VIVLARKKKLKIDWTKILDNLDKLTRLGINVGLAYASYDMWKDPLGIFYGPIALRLAESPSLPSSVAGLAGLATIGAYNLTKDTIAKNASIRAQIEAGEKYVEPFKLHGGTLACDRGYRLDRSMKMCVRIEEATHSLP